MFALKHRVEFTPGGVLERIIGAPSILVISAHFQGIDQPGENLIIEAKSTDGIVEGIRPIEGGRVLAVQWHPEWRLAENPNSVKLFSWFGTVIRGASFDEAAVASRDRVPWGGEDASMMSKCRTGCRQAARPQA